MKIRQVLHNKVMIRRHDQGETVGEEGIILAPDNQIAKSLRATVIQTGPGEWNSHTGKFIPIPLEAEQVVILRPWSGVQADSLNAKNIFIVDYPWIEAVDHTTEPAKDAIGFLDTDCLRNQDRTEQEGVTLHSCNILVKKSVTEVELTSLLISGGLEIADITASLTDGGIYVPSSAQQEDVTQTGIVVAVGPGLIDDHGNVKPMQLQVGDMILFEKNSGFELEIKGNKLLTMSETQVMAVIR